MAVNTMNFNQLSTVLAAIVGQATGKNVIAPVNTAEFVSVAKRGLETGYDPLNTAISQVLSRTIFSVRPYTRKFRGLEADEIRYGNHVRKINFADKPFEEDDRIKLEDGQSIDQQKVNKPKAIQTNFYGENVYQKSLTVYRDQLDVAFSNETEFARFVSGTMSNVQDMIEQAHESTARATLANLIGGHLAIEEDNGAAVPSVVHLISEYNAFSGQALTPATAFNPDVFPDFARYIFGRLMTLSKMLQERSAIYHQNYSDGDVMRHTPVADQRLFLMTGNMDQVAANVLSTTFNDEYLKTIPREDVMFWQAITAPSRINLTAGYTNAAGEAVSKAVDNANIFGALIDREAAGYTIVNRWNATAPFNARGGYTNYFWHFTDRYWNDYSENAIVLLLD